VATKKKDTTELQSYTFHAKALAAHFHFTDASGADFGPEYALAFHGRTPFKHKEKTGGHRHPEISFTHSWVHVITKQERGGVYTTIAKAGLKNWNVKGKVTADEIEAGIMAVYREEWYGQSDRRRSPRILPLTPVIKNLKIGGKSYQLENLQLPEPFEFSEARRKEYFAGEGPEIEPTGAAGARRFEIPDFGIVTLAEWKWLPREIHIHERTAQWVQLIGLELRNPGSGGGGGASGGGSPYGTGPDG